MSDHIQSIAKVCHEANRALCAAFGDNSQPTWENAPEWQKSSAIKGVEFHLSHPDAGPEASHNAWMAEKQATGWTWGSTKDPEAKKHPCLVPFNELPPDQQAKDYIFRSIIHSHATPPPCSIVFRDGADDDEDDEIDGSKQVSVTVNFYPNIPVVGGKLTPSGAQRMGAELAEAMLQSARNGDSEGGETD